MAREHYIIGLAYWAFWMLLGWGTYALVILTKKPRRKGKR